jgi:hypothetical protein
LGVIGNHRILLRDRCEEVSSPIDVSRFAGIDRRAERLPGTL